MRERKCMMWVISVYVCTILCTVVRNCTMRSNWNDKVYRDTRILPQYVWAFFYSSRFNNLTFGAQETYITCKHTKGVSTFQTLSTKGCELFLNALRHDLRASVHPLKMKVDSSRPQCEGNRLEASCRETVSKQNTTNTDSGICDPTVEMRWLHWRWPLS